jgi:flagellar motility protein MotE (MotC chaperone)
MASPHEVPPAESRRMIGYFRELRFIPIAVVASSCLLVLTAADLLLGHGPAVTADAPVMTAGGAGDRSLASPFGDAQRFDRQRADARGANRQRSLAQKSWAQDMFNFPGSGGEPESPAPGNATQLPAIPSVAIDGSGADRNSGGDKANAEIITGSVPGAADKEAKPSGEGKAPAASGAAAVAKEPPPTPDGTLVHMSATPGPSAAERAILEHLQERRQELDRRARELDIREGLIAEAEKRMDGKLAEIKDAQAQLVVDERKKDEAETARFKGLVTMYENMKPRDAAKIFDRLEVDVLLQVASQMNPRTMSEILAQMSPDAAERLTVELANRAKGAPKGANADLPKIEGKPTSQ